MSSKQGNIMLNRVERFLCRLGFGLFLLIIQISSVQASELSLANIGVVTLPDSRLQIQLEMQGGVATLPKVFQTDNPARIALDFSNVKNALDKKMYPIDQGLVSNVYVAAANDRVRVVVNLLESTQFETKLLDNKVLLTLSQTKASAMPAAVTHAPPAVLPTAAVATPRPIVSAAPALPITPVSANRAAISSLMPEQAISGFDFKRGSKGEGRIMVSLANPNTIVNTKQQAGKVILSFVNTRLPSNLSKRLDVSDFATPVKTIDAVSSGKETVLTVSMQNSSYDYSSFQSNGMLTVEFRPLTAGEREAIARKKKYTGDRLSLHFQEIEVRSVIAILAEFTGQNVVAGDDVTGTITLKLDDVPWDEALDFIMMTKDLGKYETGNVTLISPLDRIKTYKEKQRETERVVATLEPLMTEYIKINYANASTLIPILNGASAGVNTCNASLAGSSGSSGATGFNPIQSNIGGNTQSGTGANSNIQGLQNDTVSTDNNGDTRIGLSAVSTRGSVVVDQRTNTLIVRDTAKRIDEIRELLHKLDVPVRQVMVESRIVIASNTFLKELGVRFGGYKVASAGHKKVFGIGGAGTQGHAGGGDEESEQDSFAFGPGNQTRASIDVSDQLVSLATSSTPMGALAMTLARGADYVLNLELQALQSQGKGELISNPRVMTTDRCQATIKQGVQIPYSSADQVGTGGGGAATSTTVFVDAVLELDVTPQITPNGNVIMKLNITNNTAGATTPTGQVAIDKRELHTNVQVADGETVVLGGIFQEEIADNVDRVPFFSDLPGVGFLFRHTTKRDDKRELLVFVTPKIIKDNQSDN